MTATLFGGMDESLYADFKPDTGAQISANINSYSPGYVIHAIDSQFEGIAGTVLEGEQDILDRRLVVEHQVSSITSGSSPAYSRST